MTHTFDQVPERDEVGGVDHYVTRFDIGMECIINKAFLTYLAPRYAAYNPANAADLMSLIRQDLFQHRKAISFTFNGVNLIPGRTAAPIVTSGNNQQLAGTVDSKNGPQVLSCQVASLGEETFLLIFRVVTWWKESNRLLEGVSPTTVNQPTNDVLYNRWSETVEIDDCLYTRRIRDGAYKIRSDSNSALQVDRHRANMAAIGVPVGFRRENSRFTVTPDGLCIKYRVVDKEFYKVPPNPAYKATGEFTLSFVNMAAPVRYGDVRVRLEGSKYSNQDMLLLKAIAIASQKLLINGAPALKMKASDTEAIRPALMAGGQFRVGMWDNWVEVRLRSMLMADKSRLTKDQGRMLWILTDSTKGSFVRNMVQTPRCDPVVTNQSSNPLEFPPGYNLRGSANWLLQAAAYYEPAFAQVHLSNSDGAELDATDNPDIPGTATWNNDGPQQVVPGVLIGKAGGQRE